VTATARSNPRPSPRGFSIVELLVVIGIIVALLGILVVALNIASRRAQSAKTQFLLTTLVQGTAKFKIDIGYDPPVLGRGQGAGASPQAPGLLRDLIRPPVRWEVGADGEPNAQSVADWQQWYSITSLPEYLLGYSDRSVDGYGVFGSLSSAGNTPGAKESPPLGFRSPGEDGVWGALLNPRGGEQGNGRFDFRNPFGSLSAAEYSNSNRNSNILEGKVFGPYIDLKDTSILGGIKGLDATGAPIIVASDDPQFDSLPKVFVDYWGTPIRYYRRAYATGDLKGPDPVTLLGANARRRDLGDIFCLRPFEFRQGEDVEGVADATGDAGTLPRLKSARVGIFSVGPDKRVDENARRDAGGFNQDNLLEIGQ
jgi:type II secretory pathway pseudopilin PulG